MRLRPLLALPLLSLLLGLTALRAVDQPLPDGLYAEFTTPRGVVVAELFYDKAPLTVASFVGLAEGKLGPRPGQPFFDNLKFHRVVPGFVVQGGDPLGTGEGGPGYEFPDEFVPGLRHDAVGILSMANAGPDTNGSQFFFTLAPVMRLNYLHSVFGRTVRGVEVLPLIQQNDTFKVRILRQGSAARAFASDDQAFLALNAKAKPADHLRFDDPEGILPSTPPRARSFNFKLENFERSTGTKVFVRLLSKADPGEPDPAPAAIARRFATKFGAGPNDVVALHLTEPDVWVLAAGDAAKARLFPGSRDLAGAEQAFFTAARARAASVIATAEKAGPVDPAQKTKLLIDEVIDGLLALLEPKP
ncbi:MAG TPA: peptidylprolyl isomerase [Opitutaceae bacterium]